MASNSRISSFVRCSLGVTFVVGEARLGVPGGAGAGRLPFSNPHYLQVTLSVLGRRKRLRESSPGPHGQDEPLVGHPENLRSHPSILEQPLLKL
jgi:hypothetical protein